MTNFFEFFASDLAVTGVTPIYQYYGNGAEVAVKDRENNGLVFLTGCSARYTVDGVQVLYAPQNSAVLLPKGSSYDVTFLDSKGSVVERRVSDYLINFELTEKEFEEKLPITVSDKINPSVLLDLKDIFSVNSAIYRLTLNATFYSLLNNLFIQNKPSDGLLKPALDYIDSNPGFDQVNVNILADLCNMHISTFRRHFENMFGISPSQFIKNYFVKRADYYLVAGQYSVKNVALILGFGSASYFSRFYKENTGYMPSKIKGV